MVQRSHDTTFDLDLELARKQSQDNPVYYVQYAHARIASILRKAEAEAGAAGERDASAAAAEDALAAAAEPTERALIRRLLELPGEVGDRRRPPRAAPAVRLRDRDRSRLSRLLPRLPGGRRRAGDSSAPASPSAWRPSGRSPRTLDLIGVSAPESM